MMRATLALCLGLSACGVFPSRMARAQEAVGELNLNARFGRLGLSAEHVDPSALGDFMRRREGWGRSLRVVDTEVVGMEPTASHEVLRATVRVSWLRADEGDLRQTDIVQTWREDGQGRWRLLFEMRAGGAPGLLGEAVEPEPRAKREDRHFPTRVLAGPGSPF